MKMVFTPMAQRLKSIIIDIYIYIARLVSDPIGIGY